MAIRARILLADHDYSFLQATSQLLVQAGIACDTGTDLMTVRGMIQSRDYDVVVCESDLPGNERLQLLSAIAAIENPPRTIIVTGMPSTASACRALEMKVWAYLVKPVDVNDLKARVEAAIRDRRAETALAQHKESLGSWLQSLETMKHSLDAQFGRCSVVTIDNYLASVLHHIARGLSDIRGLIEATCNRPTETDVCQLMACPRLRAVRDAIKDAVVALEKTKRSFKSKELAAIREGLEDLLNEQLQE